MATKVLDLPEHLQLRIIELMVQSVSAYPNNVCDFEQCSFDFAKVRSLARCSIGCKSWRDLIHDQYEWPELYFKLSLPHDKEPDNMTEADMIEAQRKKACDQSFCQYIDRHLDGLKALEISGPLDQHRGPCYIEEPAIGVEQLSNILRRARQLRSVDLKYTKIDDIGEDSMMCLAKANHLRTMRFTFGDKKSRGLECLPLAIEEAYLVQEYDCKTTPSFHRLAVLKHLKVLHLRFSRRHSSCEVEDLDPIAALVHLKDLQIREAWLPYVPLWVSKLSNLESIYLSQMLVDNVSVHSGLHRLAHIAVVEGLEFYGPFSADLTVLTNIKSVHFDWDDEMIDVASLELCGPLLEELRISSERKATDGYMTVRNLAVLPGLKRLSLMSRCYDNHVDIAIEIGVGWKAIDWVTIVTGGRLLFKGEREGFHQLFENVHLRGLDLNFTTFQGSEDVEATQQGINMLLEAVPPQGFRVHQSSSGQDRRASHPTLGEGVYERCGIWKNEGIFKRLFG